MTTNSLEPCPFCGWTEPLASGCGTFGKVQCKRCNASVKSGISVDEAVDKWNRRVRRDSLFDEGESVFDMNPVDGVCCPHCSESFRVEGIPTFEAGIVEIGGVMEECVPDYCPYCGEELDLGYY